jgi:transcriptional regulator with XRE-family HTH domain
MKDEVREFLTTRRAKVTPEQAGLPTFGEKRRVPGLRREEVALLAGVSADYYIRLERGNLAGVSDQVLEAIARALRLDGAERSHLFDLARAAAGPVRDSRRAAVSTVRTGVRRILDSMEAPSYVRNARMDILAANAVAVALYDGILDELPLNLARFLFLDERAPAFFAEWKDVADSAVASLRAEVGRSPQDKSLSDLVAELEVSDEFRTRWASHDVKHHRTTTKNLRNSVVGELELTGEAMELTGDGLTIITYTVEAGTPSAEALRFLTSWAAQQPRSSVKRA